MWICRICRRGKRGLEAPGNIGTKRVIASRCLHFIKNLWRLNDHYTNTDGDSAVGSTRLVGGHGRVRVNSTVNSTRQSAAAISADSLTCQISWLLHRGECDHNWSQWQAVVAPFICSGLLAPLGVSASCPGALCVISPPVFRNKSVISLFYFVLYHWALRPPLPLLPDKPFVWICLLLPVPIN